MKTTMLRFLFLFIFLFNSKCFDKKGGDIENGKVAKGGTKNHVFKKDSASKKLNSDRSSEGVNSNHPYSSPLVSTSSESRNDLEQLTENNTGQNSEKVASSNHDIERLKNHTKEELARQAKFSNLVLTVVNELRTNPQRFKLHIEALKQSFLANKVDDKRYKIDKNTIFVTKEGIKAIDEAIAYLEKMAKAKPLRPLIHNPILDKSSLLHAKCMQDGKFFGHENIKDQIFYNPWDRVKQYCTQYSLCAENLWSGHLNVNLTEKEQAIQLVVALFVDDGVPGRGHRDNLVLNEATDLGTALWPYEGEKSAFVMNFGAGIVE
jgi:uncharacterized protein YkwD